MARTASEYKQQYKALLPPGRLWDALRQEGCVADRFFAAQAEEFARVDKRAEDLLAEVDPRRALEMFPDWEEWAGLPDVCTATVLTLQQRCNALVQKLTSVGGQSRAYFISVAAFLGYEITIEEFEPHTCETGCDQPIYDEEWRFAWKVQAPEQTIIEFTCESPCDEPLRAWGNELLECTIERLKPAHTHVLFGYGDNLSDDLIDDIQAWTGVNGVTRVDAGLVAPDGSTGYLVTDSTINYGRLSSDYAPCIAGDVVVWDAFVGRDTVADRVVLLRVSLEYDTDPVSYSNIDIKFRTDTGEYEIIYPAEPIEIIDLDVSSYDAWFRMRVKIKMIDPTISLMACNYFPAVGPALNVPNSPLTIGSGIIAGVRLRKLI